MKSKLKSTTAATSAQPPHINFLTLKLVSHSKDFWSRRKSFFKRCTVNMDIFKLLTRSSNLQKSGPSASQPYQKHIPSAGISYQSRKRKREQDNEEGLNGYDSQEFLGNGVERDVGGEPNDLLNSSSSMNELERRRILKQHKLKITLLCTETIPTRLLAKKEKKVQEDEGRKDAFIQLTPDPLTSFEQLKSKYRISKRLIENLKSQGYIMPTEVQIGSLPILLGTDRDRGISSQEFNEETRPISEVDLLTVAPTGSGKTLAFLLHLIKGLLQDSKRHKRELSDEENLQEVRALIIAPTHELAAQIVNEGRKLTAGIGLRITGLKKNMKLGGSQPLSGRDGQPRSNNHAKEDAPEQESLVKTDILVSTPMALVNSISSTPDSTSDTLPGIRFLVLDEADILLDPLFRPQTLSIWSACNNPALRTSLWSATIGSSIESLAMSFIRDRRKKLKLPLPNHPPHHIIRLVVGLKDSAVSNISHRLVYTATEQGKLMALRQMLHPAAVSAGDAPSIQPPFLIFTQTIPRAIALHSELLYDVPLEAGGSSRIAVLHSDLSMSTRAAIMAGFRRGEIWILITTDLLSRGVDFRGVNGVVNYDIPNTGAAYIHRAGRTGRQQREGGIAVTFYTKDDIPYVKNVANVIARSGKTPTSTKNGTSHNTHHPAQGRGQGEGQGTVEKWLLDALPSVSKKTKKELKRKGVESRRTITTTTTTTTGGGGGGGGGGGSTKIPAPMRISTKSGYDRKLEHRRRETLARARARERARQSGRDHGKIRVGVGVGVGEERFDDGDDGEGWEGISD